MDNFVTLFDKNFISRGIALHNSLVKFESNKFILYIVSMDSYTTKFFEFLKIDNVKIISIPELEKKYPVLIELEKQRTRREFCWTLSAFSVQYVIQEFHTESCTYVDADICFFNDPNLLFKQIKIKSVLITEHYFSPEYDQSYTSGKYCVQFVYFKNDKKGNEVLEWWRRKCEEWCFSYLDKDRFGDQKYFDDWDNRFDCIFVPDPTGVGLAPWNFDKFDLFEDNNVIYAKDKITKLISPVIFYHFHELRYMKKNIWKLMPEMYSCNKEIYNYIYKPYIDEIVNINKIYEISEYSKVNDSLIFNGIKYVLSKSIHCLKLYFLSFRNIKKIKISKNLDSSNIMNYVDVK
jgi:hypothetical protein